MSYAEDSKHFGTFRTLSSQTDAQLLRSIRSYRANIAEHRQKKEAPDLYVRDWDDRSAEYRKGILAKWNKDILRNTEQLEIALNIAAERRLHDE